MVLLRYTLTEKWSRLRTKNLRFPPGKHLAWDSSTRWHSCKARLNASCIPRFDPCRAPLSEREATPFDPLRHPRKGYNESVHTYTKWHLTPAASPRIPAKSPLPPPLNAELSVRIMCKGVTILRLILHVTPNRPGNSPAPCTPDEPSASVRHSAVSNILCCSILSRFCRQQAFTVVPKLSGDTANVSGMRRRLRRLARLCSSPSSRTSRGSRSTACRRSGSTRCRLWFSICRPARRSPGNSRPPHPP